MKLNHVNHIGVSVGDLDRSIEFYRMITGGELEFVNDMRGEGLARVTGEADPLLRFCMIRLGNTVLELIEWQRPRGAENSGAGTDVGKIHIAFETDEIEAVYERLQANGVEFLAAPHTFTDADGAPDVKGATFVYFSDPDGVGLEIFEPAKS